MKLRICFPPICIHAVLFYVFTVAAVINKPEDTRDLFNTDKEEQTRH